MHIVKMILRFLYGAFFIFTGYAHFSDKDFFLQIMPDYIPTSLHLPAVYASGVAEIALGVLLFIPQTKRWAGWGLIALLIAVFPANIYAYQHTAEIFPKLNPALSLWRLPLQGVLIAWAYWYTRPDARDSLPPEDVAA